MKVIIEGDAKEIAALVLEIQERQVINSKFELCGNELGIKLCADDALKCQ